jgi:rhamnosyltransferase subunit B
VAEVQARWFVRPAFEAIARLHQPGRTVVAAQSLVFGALVAREKLGVPTAMLHLSPFVLRSLDLPPVRPDGTRWPRPPRPVAAAAAWMFDRFVLDRHFGPATFALRRELGLPHRHHLFHQWMFEADANIAWWPDWFAPRQRDWPPMLQFAGFPLFDGVAAELDRQLTGTVPSLSPALERWLVGGTPPVVVTPGSANPRGAAMIGAAIDAARELDRRLLILTTFTDSLRLPLPAGVHLEAYAPLAALLPRCAAIIHHGGLGTAARALMAAIPQVVVPAAFDNPDNAWWLARLGAATIIPPQRLSCSTIARALLCEPPSMAAFARSHPTQESATAFAAVADSLERLVR